MILRALRVAAMAGSLAVAASCGPADPSSPTISLSTPTPGNGPAFVEVRGLSAARLSTLAAGSRSPEAWAAILRVSVAADGPPVIGDYRVAAKALRFTPAFPFDPGREYRVQFDERRIASAGEVAAAVAAPLVATVRLPAAAHQADTTVTQIYPSAATLPENLLRIYIHFSAPMGLSPGIDHIALLDTHGSVVEGTFLPLDYEFWNHDRTRFTAFLDPGRVKRGILPNRQSGRALKRGDRYTLVVRSTWRDGNGQPLKDEFRRDFVAGPADLQPLDTAAWRIDAPADGRAPLVVTFPEPLDQGLLLRALGVRRDGKALDGDARVEAAETRWIFTPRQPWSGGRHDLVALSILEDLAGNQIGRAFEVDNFESVDQDPDPKTIVVPFDVGSRVAQRPGA